MPGAEASGSHRKPFGDKSLKGASQLSKVVGFPGLADNFQTSQLTLVQSLSCSKSAIKIKFDTTYTQPVKVQLVNVLKFLFVKIKYVRMFKTTAACMQTFVSVLSSSMAASMNR